METKTVKVYFAQPQRSGEIVMIPVNDLRGDPWEMEVNTVDLVPSKDDVIRFRFPNDGEKGRIHSGQVAYRIFEKWGALQSIDIILEGVQVERPPSRQEE